MPELDALKNIIAASDNIVFFGGAGVSTESDIPDFRGPQGLYKSKTIYGEIPETLLSYSFFQDNPEKFFRFHLNEMIFPEAKPNAAHHALARLEHQGKLKTIITQNIDGLHQLAGSHQVIELHGSVLRNYCMNCGLKYDVSFMLDHKKTIPHCRDCGGIVRPDVVLYEERLNTQVLRDAQKAIALADVLIVGGTSLVVYPAAGLVRDFRGQKLVLINKSATDYDRNADLIIRENISHALNYAIPI